MKEEHGSDRLKNMLIKEDLGIPTAISEILKYDLYKLFSEYLYLKNDGVSMSAGKEEEGLVLKVVVHAAGVKNARIIS